jgi:uroporphyrinogen decarboxylase
MTRRERVLRTIAHREPDRIPVDLGGMRSTGITAIAYGRLKKHLGITAGRTQVYDVVQQLAQPEQSILDFSGSDVVDLGRAFLDREDDWQPFTLPDGSDAFIPAPFRWKADHGGWLALGEDGEVLGRMPAGALYLNQVRFPLEDWDGRDLSVLDRLPEAMDRVSWAAFPSPPWHKPLTPGHLRDIGNRAKDLCENTDYAIMAGFGGNLLEWGQYLCRFDRFLMDLLDNPRKVSTLLDKLVEMHVENLEKFLDAVSGHVQIVAMGDDLGTQLASQVSPQMYREIFKPRHRQIYERVRRRSGMHLFLHSCGAIADLLPDLIDIGVEIINPVQTSAAGMDPARLKREFGKDITFWGGGCDTQTVLPNGTPGEVEAHVRERLKIFSPGGGFVFTQIHNIMPNVPPRNVEAMYRAVRNYGL